MADGQNDNEFSPPYVIGPFSGKILFVRHLHRSRKLNEHKLGTLLFHPML